MTLNVVNGILEIEEEQGGTRGSSYYYLKMGEELLHISKLFKGKAIDTRRGRRITTYKYRIPLSSLRDMLGDEVEIYEFSFSNSGHGPYCRVYKIDCIAGAITERSVTTHPNFRIERPEKGWLDWYDQLVPKMITRIKEIEHALGIKLFFAKKSVRLEDIYNDPIKAKNTALILPKPEKRIGALQRYIQETHELYVLMLVAEALGGKTIYPSYGKPTWQIAHAQDRPTAIVESNGRELTIWYQFSIKTWVEVILPGFIRAFIDSGAKKKLDVETKSRQYVKPDIVIFEGKYESREDLRRSVPKNIILIDAKLEISERDLKQLKEYRKLFDSSFGKERMHYVVACLGKAEYKEDLEKAGLIVVENVSPNGNEMAFKNILKSLLSVS